MQIQLSNRTNISTPGKEIKNERAKLFISLTDKRKYMPLLSKHAFSAENAEFLCLYFSLCLNKSMLQWNIGSMCVVQLAQSWQSRQTFWLTKEQDDSSEVGDLCSRIYELTKSCCKRHMAHKSIGWLSMLVTGRLKKCWQRWDEGYEYEWIMFCPSSTISAVMPLSNWIIAVFKKGWKRFKVFRSKTERAL